MNNLRMIMDELVKLLQKQLEVPEDLIIHTNDTSISQSYNFGSVQLFMLDHYPNRVGMEFPVDINMPAWIVTIVLMIQKLGFEPIVMGEYYVGKDGEYYQNETAWDVFNKEQRGVNRHVTN